MLSGWSPSLPPLPLKPPRLPIPTPLPRPPQVLPRREGLLRVGEWGPTFTRAISDEAREGQLVDVMVTEASADGKFKVSRKAVLAADAAAAAAGILDGDGGDGGDAASAAVATAPEAAAGKENEEPGAGGGKQQEGDGGRKLKITVR